MIVHENDVVCVKIKTMHDNKEYTFLSNGSSYKGDILLVVLEINYIVDKLLNGAPSKAIQATIHKEFTYVDFASVDRVIKALYDNF